LSNLVRRISEFWAHKELTILAVLVALFFWRLTLISLPSSLWIDEAGTFWVSSGNFAQLIESIRETQFPQMPLYAFTVWLWRQVAGSSEVALRLPSVFAFVAGGYGIKRLARALYPGLPQAPLYCLLCYGSISTVTFASADARAYSLGLLCLIWCYCERVNTLQSASLWPLLRHGLAAGLTLHFCYFFGAALAADFLFLAYAFHRRLAPFSFRYLLSPVVAAITVAPLAPLLAVVLRESKLHVSESQLPTWRDLGAQWAPPRFVIALVVSTLVYFLLRRYLPPAGALLRPPAEQAFSQVLFWAIGPSLVIFLYSLATGKSIFIDRYLLSQAPGLALVAGGLAASLTPPLWRGAFVTFLALIALSGGGLKLWKNHSAEDWRQAAALVRTERSAAPDMPFLASSCFLESNHLPMPVTPAQLVFLRAYMLPYNFPGEALYLPAGLNEANRGAVVATLEQAARSPRFLLLTIADSNLNRWIEGYFANRFRFHVLHDNPRLLRLEKIPAP
jgi:hypothetical protein